MHDAQGGLGQVAPDRVDHDVRPTGQRVAQGLAQVAGAVVDQPRGAQAFAASSFSADEATAVTVAPRAAPSCTAAVPTPPPAPSTTSSSPGGSSATERSTWYAVR